MISSADKILNSPFSIHHFNLLFQSVFDSSQRSRSYGHNALNVFVAEAYGYQRECKQTVCCQLAVSAFSLSCFSAYSILKYSMNASKSSLLHFTVVPPSAISLCSLFPRLTVSASCFLMSSIFFSVSLFPFPCPCPMPPCSPSAACTSLSSPCLPPSGFLPGSSSFCGIRLQL